MGELTLQRDYNQFAHVHSEVKIDTLSSGFVCCPIGIPQGQFIPATMGDKPFVSADISWGREERMMEIKCLVGQGAGVGVGGGKG